MGRVNLSTSDSKTGFSVLRLGASLPAGSRGVGCLGTCGLVGNPAGKSLFCRSATTDLRSFSDGTGPDALMNCPIPVALGFIGRTGGTAGGGDGFESVAIGRSLTKFSGKSPLSWLFVDSP